MTDCPNGDVRDMLPDLVHERLTPDVRRGVEAHVRTCADCQAELALLRAMRASLRRGPAVDSAVIAAAIPAYRAAVRRSWAGWRVAAAVVVLAAGGTSAVVLGRGGDSGAHSLRLGAPMVLTAESATPVAVASVPRELAMGNSAIGDLDDGALSALLRDLETIEVLPPADVEQGAVVSPVAPAGTE